MVAPGNAEASLVGTVRGDPQVCYRNQLVAGIEQRQSLAHPRHDAFLLQELLQFLRTTAARGPDRFAAEAVADPEPVLGEVWIDAAFDIRFEGELTQSGPEVQRLLGQERLWRFQRLFGHGRQDVQVVPVAPQLDAGPGNQRLCVCPGGNQLMNRLVQARCRRWRQAAHTDGLAQEVALSRRRQRPYDFEVETPRGAGSGQVDIGEILEKRTGLAREVGALPQACRYRGPARGQLRNDLLAQEIPVEPGIHIARVVDPVEFMALCVFADGFAGHAEQRP